MKAIVFDEKIGLQEKPLPTPGQGEALLQVLETGICNTDIEITRGYHHFRGTLGHEFVAMVKEAPKAAWVGKRVVGEINCVCHKCDLCVRGFEKHCRRRTVLGIVNRDGALAEFCVLPLENLHEVPEAVSEDEAVFVEPLAAACEILEQIEIQPKDRVCVIGDGKLAQLIVQVLAAESRLLTVVGRHRSKLDLLTRYAGEALLSNEIEKDLDSMCGAFDVVVEATGSPEGFQRAVRWTRPRGTLVMKSTYHQDLSFDAAPLVVNEIRVIGSRCGPFPKALEKLRRREIDVKPLISDRFSLGEGEAAFRRAVEPGILKVLVKI